MVQSAGSLCFVVVDVAFDLEKAQAFSLFLLLFLLFGLAGNTMPAAEYIRLIWLAGELA